MPNANGELFLPRTTNMAITATDLTPEPTRVPIIGPIMTTKDSWMTQVPKAEIVFSGNNETVTAAAAGESQRLRIHCLMPKGFAYVFMEGSVQMRETEVDDLNDWSDNASCLITADEILLNDFVYYKQIDKPAEGAPSSSETLKEAVYTFRHEGLNKVINPRNNSQPVLRFDTTNLVIDGGPLTTYFYFRFLQFDLNQAFYWAVNSPFATR